MSKTLTLDEFINNANIVHNNKYDYSKSVYINNKTLTIITCPKHGDFMQIPRAHLRGHECILCGREATRLTTQEFIAKSNTIHNFKYDYSKSLYITANLKVIIICPHHGEFLQKPFHHLLNHGCPTCRASKGEIAVRKYLIDNFIEYVTEKSFNNCINPSTNRKLRFDFYLPKYNLLIEFDGEQHFKPICYRRTDKSEEAKMLKLLYTQMLDKIKNDYAKINGINLLRISYKDIESIQYIMDSTISSLCP